jgi:hypothetical protein
MKLKITNFVRIIIDSNLNWEVHVERTCSRISCNLYLINRLSKVLDLHEKGCVVVPSAPFYHLGLYGDSAKAFTRRIFIYNTRNDNYINVLDLEQACPTC